MTRIVRQLVLANVVVFVIQQVAGDGLFTHFALWPLGEHFVYPFGEVGFAPWQLLTSAFLHDPSSLLHIGFNMFALWSFGGMVERAVGSNRFLVLYFASVVTAGIVQLLVVTATADHGAVPTVGASGGVFGVLLAFAWYFPRERLFIIPIPIPLPAWLFVTLYGGLELFLGVTGRQEGVAHFAHLGGMLGGALCILYWRARHRFS